MGNLITPLVPTSSHPSTNDSSDSSSIDFTTFPSYSYYGGIFRYEKVESIYENLKHTIDGILSIHDFDQWSSITTLDLRQQKLTGLDNLSTILPSLESLILSDNLIQELSGLPVSIRTLRVNQNRLTNINGILPLVNLDYLDICNNGIMSFKGIEMLKGIRVLHAENNKVKSCAPFQFMRALKYLNLRGNRLSSFVFGDSTQLNNLEVLDVSYNRISVLEFIKGFAELRVLKLEHNELESLIVRKPLVKLRSLYLCFNRLTVFNGSYFPDLRTLHADDNHISCLLFMDTIPRLTEISLRDQCGQLGELDLQNFPGARSLLLAGNPIRGIHNLVNFGALEYLELCSAGLYELPRDIAQQAPNLTGLCLGHNSLSSIEPLRNLRKLHKLVVVNNRLKDMKGLAKCLRSMKTLRYLDLRDNPISFRYYPTTVIATESRKGPCQCAMETQKTDWCQQDNEYLQEISPNWLQRRTIYRAILLKSSSSLVVIDGILVSSEERSQALGIVSQHYQQHL